MIEKKLRKLSINQQIISRLIPEESKFNKDIGFWKRETKILKKLTEKYGSDFLLWLEKPNFSLTSLAWFLSEYGERYISEHLVEYNRQKDYLNNKQNVKDICLSSNKIGEDFNIKKSPTNVKDFLNYVKR